MPEKMILFSGSSSVGKTAVLRRLLPYLKEHGHTPMVCKIDCLCSEDAALYCSLGIHAVSGLSQDICPDHFLVSNLPELLAHANRHACGLLFIETAGLCHRCSPATEHSISGCVLDCTASFHTPARLGPMLTQADFLVLTKIDMISQAELELVRGQLNRINPGAVLFPIDGLAGYGIEPLGDWLLSLPDCKSFENDRLRHSMPAGVCSYCVGETRVGGLFQQGVVGKIEFGDDL
ncbi:MAG: cobalamin biosynthesis protein P47K [Lachnospiraceae bacterium]|jgi:Ni2+-binding GTPase involved in maturation of urease and hydrogenase|nr:cobalamin biosynthesis protein P47K [Lachnospiraceae bacterium]